VSISTNKLVTQIPADRGGPLAGAHSAASSRMPWLYQHRRVCAARWTFEPWTS